MESILTSIKKLLGIEEEYDHFDADLIMHINTAFMILTQIGVGPSEGFSIQDDTAVWTDFIPKDSNLEAVKTYIHLKVRLIFDPPTNPGVTDTINRTLTELECRLNYNADAIKQ